MITRLASLLVKELIQFTRDRMILMLILYFYTLCIILCSAALTFDVKRLPMGIVDLSRSPSSRSLVEKFRASETFDIKSAAMAEKEMERAFRNGGIRLALVIPPEFESQLRRGGTIRLQLILDGANSNTANLARGYARQVLASFEMESRARGAGPILVARPVIRFWYNPRQDFAQFMVLSMIALASLLVGMIHPAATFVREKEKGTIEQLMVTPITTVELFVAKTLPTLGMGVLSVFTSLLIVRLFRVPMRGSLPLFICMTALFLLSAIGLGVLVASISKTMQQALLLTFFALFPIMFLSGSLVPVESMPFVLERLSLLSPLRHYMDVILGIFLKGTGLRELWPQTLALVAIGSPLFGFSLLVFRRNVS